MKHFAILSSILVLSLSAFAQTQEVDDPIKNFDALWSTFDERYANFELKEVDWESMYEDHRVQITEETTNLELYQICCAMVQELRDGHVTITPYFAESDIACDPPYPFLYDEIIQSAADAAKFVQAMDSTFSIHGFSAANHVDVTTETNFQYRTSNQYGYLRFDEMTEQVNLKPLERALDEALGAFKEKQAVIIDLRFNGGGWDYAGYKIANRFVNEKRLGHFKKQRKKDSEEFSKLKSFYLKPSGAYQYTKPVIILTSDATASAAEVFLLALKDLPYVTIVGDTTEGIFSDMYEFTLPNTWEISLSHQQFFDANMVNYEGVGIVPDHEVLNSKEDMNKGIDGVILKAISVLEELQK